MPEARFSEAFACRGACLTASAAVLVGVACGTSKTSDTVAAIDACVDRQAPAISDPLFRQRVRQSVRTFCVFAAGKRDVLSQDGSVSRADEKRILQARPEIVSNICARSIGFRKLPKDPETLRQKVRAIEAEQKKVCAVFLRRLR